MSNQKRYIAYYRVSTQRQGLSGLGLDAQKKAVREHLGNNGWPPIKEFTEVESGAKNDRPQLLKALKACRVHQAQLVIAKLDRLARNAAFLINLQDSEVEFLCCDNPTANRLTIGILALVAEEEAKAISTRTKAALAAAKARGVKLGVSGPSNLKNRHLGTQRGSATNRRKATERAQDLSEELQPLVGIGASLRTMADHLNCCNIRTARGGKWTAVQVKRVLDRLSG